MHKKINLFLFLTDLYQLIIQTSNRGDEFRFRCQHGPRECQGNTYHACAARYIREEEDRLDYIRCMIEDNYNPPRDGLR